MNIAALIKNLVSEIENRNNHLTASCPSLSDENERKSIFGHITATQEEIDKIVGKIRECTASSFMDFSDEELLLACYIWASIWTDHPSVQVTSRSFIDVIGRNRIGRLPSFLEGLLNGRSPLLKYVSMQWQSRYRGECCYTFKIEKIAEFNALFLGKASIA